MPNNGGNGGNGGEKGAPNIIGFTKGKPKEPSEAEHYRRQARGVDFARNVDALVKKLGVAPLKMPEEKLGITLEGTNGQWYAWDEVMVKLIAYLEKLKCEAEKK